MSAPNQKGHQVALQEKQQEAESIMAEIGPMIEELPADAAAEVVEHLDGVLQSCKKKVNEHKSDRATHKVEGAK